MSSDIEIARKNNSLIFSKTGKKKNVKRVKKIWIQKSPLNFFVTLINSYKRKRNANIMTDKKISLLENKTKIEAAIAKKSPVTSLLNIS